MFGIRLFKISSNDSSEKFYQIKRNTRLIFIYTGLTAMCAISYKILGMNTFDSLTHSMTTIATGSFQITTSLVFSIVYQLNLSNDFYNLVATYSLYKIL